MTIDNFATGTVGPGKPVIGEAIPDKYRVPDLLQPNEPNSPLENTFHFATGQPHPIPKEQSGFGSTPFKDYSANDPNIPQWIRDRLASIADHTDTLMKNRDIREVKGRVSGTIYVCKKDATYPYWRVDGYPSAFTNWGQTETWIENCERQIELIRLQDAIKTNNP